MSFEDTVDDVGILANRRKMAQYSDSYKQVAFQVWYSNDRPKAGTLKSILPPDEMSRVPSEVILVEWINSWVEDADRLDIEVKKINDLELITQRADMLKRQARNAKTLQDMGMDYLVEHGFEKAGEAVRAIVEGTRIERESRGLGEALDRIFKMDDEALRKELEYLLNREKGIIVDGEVSEVDDASNELSPSD